MDLNLPCLCLYDDDNNATIDFNSEQYIREQYLWWYTVYPILIPPNSPLSALVRRDIYDYDTFVSLGGNTRPLGGRL